MALADTTNREKQLSPVPSIFVGGVGLECQSKPKGKMQFLLLTKDRKKLSVAKFNDDDVTYDFWPITKTTPEQYIADNKVKQTEVIQLDRKSLQMTFDVAYDCKLMNISNLHRNAANYLRTLLSENKI